MLKARSHFRRNSNLLKRLLNPLCIRVAVHVALGVSWQQMCMPPLQAQETASAQGAPEKGQVVRITFLPPPLEGTLSLGVYDRSGKRVRSLHTEATTADFTISLNGLSTTWDGKDDSGQALPPGKYRIKGFAVGDLELTGEAFHGNDWVTIEDGPHPIAFHDIRIKGDVLELTASEQTGQRWVIKETLSRPEETSRFEAAPQTVPDRPASMPTPTSCPGRNGTRWSIENIHEETVVVQTDSKGKVLRHLSIGAGEPTPVALGASQTADEVFLLERDGERWRVRGLRRKPTLGKTPPEAEDPKVRAAVWETFFEKNRWPCSKFSDVANRVGRPKAFVPEAQLTVPSQFNPLLGGANSDVSIAVGFDGMGSFLKTADGLLLRRLTDTQQLRWAVLGRDTRQPAVVFLQSDGAVVEEYRILQPASLMAFDAGDYQWPPR